MENKDFEQLYEIDEKKLKGYHDRIKNQFKNLTPIQVVAKFLFSTQSIGSSMEGVVNVLTYFTNKIVPDKDMLDFSLEWIRAQKIRFEYKKYLGIAQFPDYELALDDSIFKFFLHYDEHIRQILKEDIGEHVVSTLYQIFFSPEETRIEDVNVFLKKHESKVPTIFLESGNEKVKAQTNIITLREGFSEIIYNDNKKYLPSDSKEIPAAIDIPKKKLSHVIEHSTPFRGFLLERQVKAYCISKNKLEPREIENAISQFLSSYFKFGILYKCDEFRDSLITCITEDLFSGLSEKVKQKHPRKSIKTRFEDGMKECYEHHDKKELDGSAWKLTLKPILTKILIDYIEVLI